MCETMRR